MLAVYLWLAGMPGVVSVAWLVVPPLARSEAPDVPVWLVGGASAMQGGLLLALAVWAGCRLAPVVGLNAPLFSALAESRPLCAAMRGRVLPGLVGGAAGALLLVASAMLGPDALHRVQETLPVPLPVRLLYGGLPAELLMRWGFMTVIVWLLWRLARRRSGAPGRTLIWTAIACSAILFGLGHLPAVSASVGTLPLSLAVYVVMVNATFGIVAGVLFWRWGLEAAMLAHVTAHLFAAAVFALAATQPIQ